MTKTINNLTDLDNPANKIDNINDNKSNEFFGMKFEINEYNQSRVIKEKMND